MQRWRVGFDWICRRNPVPTAATVHYRYNTLEKSVCRYEAAEAHSVVRDGYLSETFMGLLV